MPLELPKRVPVAQPLRIAILNLMPKKIEAEADYARLLSASPLPLEVHLMKVRSHVCKNTSAEHMQAYYRFFDEMREERFDGFIITGAPVELLEFEQVDYWDELCDIFAWARTHVASTLFICWAAQAGLYYHYGVRKYPLGEKMFGIFPQVPLLPELPIFTGFDDVFNMPHSRHTEVREEDILKVPELTLIAKGALSGVSMVMARGGKDIFVTGHAEYAPMRLDTEYRRDLGKGLPIKMPYNYYRDDDPEKGPLVTWRGHGTMLFQNWLNHYVYQETSYDIDEIR